MKATQIPRLAAMSGAAYFVLSLAGHFAIGNEPPFMARAAVVKVFYTDHQSSILAGNTLYLLSAIALVIFAATLRSAIRAGSGAESEGRGGDDNGGLLAGVVFGATIAATALMFASASIEMAGAIHVQEKHMILAAEASVFWDLGQLLYGLAAPMALVAAVLGCAIASLRHRTLPVWLGALSIPMGVALAIPPINHVSMVVFTFWVLVASLVLAVRGAADPSAMGVRTTPVAG